MLKSQSNAQGMAYWLAALSFINPLLARIHHLRRKTRWARATSCAVARPSCRATIVACIAAHFRRSLAADLLLVKDGRDDVEWED